MKMKKLSAPLLLMLLVLLLLSPAEQAHAAALSDGEYLVAVTLHGGSGRVEIASPVQLTVANGIQNATIIWDSPYYEFMTVDGVTYSPLEEISAAETTAFCIPIQLDTEMQVSAQTIAMSQPHEITYSLYFDSATLQPLHGEENGSAFLARAIIIAAIALLAFFLWKRQRRSHRPPQGGTEHA